MTETEQKWSSVRLVSEAADPNTTSTKKMEDAHVVIDGFGGKAEQGLFCVFDGHGGRQIVNFLEQNFANVLEENVAPLSLESSNSSCLGRFLSSSSAKPDQVMEAIIKTFTEVDQKSSEILVSGSTVACCLVRPSKKGRKLFVANVGDSRAVIATGDAEAKRLTYDHTALDPAEVKRIEKAGGFILRKRILGILSVARAIGDHTMKKYVISRPHTTIVDITENEKFLIIACDGVWDVFEDDQAVKFIAEGLEKGTFTEENAAASLVEAAKERGSEDNITAVIVFF